MFTTKRIVEQSIIASLYVVLTLVIRPIGSLIQIRLSELLVVLIIINKRHLIGVTLGCLLANLFSEFAYLDVPFGTLATLVAGLGMIAFRNRYHLELIFPVAINGLVVGAMLHVFLHENFTLMVLAVATSEFITLFLLGIPILYLLKRNESIYQYLK